MTAMMPTKRTAARSIAVAAVWLTAALGVAGPKFRPDDPVWVDRDNLSIPAPRTIELSKGFDLLENTYLHRGGPMNEAPVNVNTLGEVPDSSWFQNRMTLRPLTLEALVRGPDRGPGPDLSRPLTVKSLKTEGITPGFTVVDARGQTYVVKVDPASAPQLTTSAEVVGTKFFYAFGYHVPENYLAFVRHDQLRVGPESKFTDADGRKRLLTQRDLDHVLERVPVRPDGTIQIMASLFLSGKPVGRLKYFGTRSDDANDVFPHENRRELRGLRVFDSWLNHNDSDGVNSLDMYVTEEGRKFIRHYLIDFGTVLGSGAFEPKALRAGNEYYIEAGPILRSAVTLGLWDRPWRTLRYPDIPAVGRFESDFFRPERWKPDYPNAAHDRMQSADAFWATRTVARFTDPMVRALVRTGRYGDPAAEEALVSALIRRRDKIVRYYFGLLNPLDAFAVDAPYLTFRNLGAEAGLGPGGTYAFQWFRYDNQERLDPLGEARSVTDARIPLPAERSPYMMVRIRTHAAGQPNWYKRVDVYLRSGSALEVVGIEREN
jgi:hypothetical protein